MTTRVRFAPSPTGNLHLGGARTALFNWLWAKHTGGAFLLRIEDTDGERSTEQSTNSIYEGMSWLNMIADEEPIIQSKRAEEHKKLAYSLLESGMAYKCYCTEEELESMKELARTEGLQPKYNRKWRYAEEQNTDKPFVIRFKMPIEGSTTIKDVVLGDVTVNHEELDDLVILRSDGTPTYNFVVVCDDSFMGITHVVRGQDHLSNTFRQYHIYKALGFDPPVFAHLPKVDGFSKRKGSPSVQSYRDRGFLMEAVINYIARLGWSHGDQEVFSIDELCNLFDLDAVHSSPAKYDEDKLIWFNQQWIKRLDAKTIAERIVPFLENIGIHTELNDKLIHLVTVLQERSKDLIEMADLAKFAYIKPTTFDDKAIKKWMQTSSRPMFEEVIHFLLEMKDEDFTVQNIDSFIHSLAEKYQTSISNIAQPIRIAITGTSISPPIYDSIFLTGREETISRMNFVLNLFS